MTSDQKRPVVGKKWKKMFSIKELLSFLVVVAVGGVDESIIHFESVRQTVCFLTDSIARFLWTDDDCS